MSDIVKIQEEINREVAKKEVVNALVGVTFQGLDIRLIKRALMEGMMLGWTFEDFLKKNVYAIPFNTRQGLTYSLVSSIDYSRKVGMHSGVVGKSAPQFTYKPDGSIDSCTITIKRKVSEHIGDYSATVFFEEYNTKRNLWITKPRTMIAKVAEMHALRMACPEELAKSYIEEELESEVKVPVINLTNYEKSLTETKNLQELKTIWSSLPAEVKTKLEPLKNELKTKYANS